VGPLQHRPAGRRGRLTPAVDLTTELSRPADEVWAAVTTPAGVNAELGPLVRMTFPKGAMADLASAPRDEPLFACWLLAFGLIPFDRHVLVMHEVGERHFIETSHSLLQKLWRHERYVTPTGQGCTVRDVVTVTPRLGFAGPISRALAAAVFRHRHRRLKALYG
jgi:ligand-binding SRPBCC domain-containing protein